MTSKLYDEIDKFWSSEDIRTKKASHLYGAGKYGDKELWKSLGTKHRKIYEDIAREYDLGTQSTMLEWGPGGGTNVLAFSDIFNWIIGVDICKRNLQKCQETMMEMEVNNFLPFHSPIACPEEAKIIRLFYKIDFVLCTAVLQHMPHASYVSRVLKVFSELVRDSGYGLFQFRTNRGKPDSVDSPRRSSSYTKHVANWFLVNPGNFESMLNKSGWEALKLIGNPQGKSGYLFYLCRNK